MPGPGVIEPSPWLYLTAVLAVAVGALLQRMSGTGLGLVLGPVVAALLGPSTSVLFVNTTGLVVSGMILPTVRRDIEWRRAAAIVAWAVPGSAVGLWLASIVPAPALTAGIGAIVLLGLGVTFAMRRLPHVEGGRLTAGVGFAAHHI